MSGIYGQVMTFAHALLFSSVALAALVMKPTLLRQLTRIPHWVFVAATILAGISLYFTYTRGAVLAAAVCVVLFSPFSTRVVS